MKQWELNGVTVDLNQPALSTGASWRDEWLRILTERIPAVIWTTDIALRITSSLGAGLAAIGLVPNQVVGLTLFDFYGTQDAQLEPIAAHFRAIEGDSVSYDDQWDGRTFYCHVEPLHDSGGHLAGTIGAALDITDRKKAEHRLREAEARYHALVVQIPAITYVDAADEDRSAIFISPQVEEVLGYSPEEWKADPGIWTRLLHPEDRDRVLAEARRSKRSGEPFKEEYRLLARDGHLVWVHDEAVLLRDPTGQPSIWQGVMIDVADRRPLVERTPS